MIINENKKLEAKKKYDEDHRIRELESNPVATYQRRTRNVRLRGKVNRQKIRGTPQNV